MFVGREDELATLEELYGRQGFQMVVVYGRRRVGKTTLIDEFVKGKRVLYFTGQVQSSALNLRAFSRRVFECFGMPDSTPPFAAWSDAFGFVAERSRGDRLVFVFDEFPYAARTEPGLPSALQVSIDHGFLQGNVFMVLCGSSEGFMESEVLGAKSPLYGRRTAQIHLGPFDYLDAARMLPDAPAVERIEYYAAFGGTPYYLAQLDAGKGLAGNVADLMFRKAGLLYEEPMMLLRQEVREPALYSSVLQAVATGAGEPAKIASAAGIEANSVGKYLRILEGLGLIERTLPFGENRVRSRRGLYVVADPFFAFWYRFVAGAVGAIEMGAGEAVARQVCDGQALPTFVGRQFERIALQWVARANRAGKLPFLATELGRWWGNDPEAREQVDIDIVAANREEGAALFGECTWRNDVDGSRTLETLERRSDLVASLRSARERTYLLVTKNEAGRPMQKVARERGDVKLLSTADLYDV